MTHFSFLNQTSARDNTLLTIHLVSKGNSYEVSKGSLENPYFAIPPPIIQIGNDFNYWNGLNNKIINVYYEGSHISLENIEVFIMEQHIGKRIEKLFISLLLFKALDGLKS